MDVQQSVKLSRRCRCCTCRCIEPPSAKPVIVEDDVVIGANVVVLEGVTVGKGAVVAGAVVTEDVPPYTVVAGTPARVIKEIDEKTKAKLKLNKNFVN